MEQSEALHLYAGASVFLVQSLEIICSAVLIKNVGRMYRRDGKLFAELLRRRYDRGVQVAVRILDPVVAAVVDFAVGGLAPSVFYQYDVAQIQLGNI